MSDTETAPAPAQQTEAPEQQSAAEEQPAAAEATPEKQPVTALEPADAAIPADQTGDEGAVVVADGEPKMLSHVERAYRSSETRTPIVIAGLLATRDCSLRTT